MQEQTKDYFAKFNLYTSMAHYVAKVLHQRPNDILDHWGVPELIVAFGEYANERAKQNHEDWKNLDSETKGRITKPNEYAVYFHDIKSKE